MKNSSRFDEKIARNFARSSSGVRSSSASCRTRRLNSSQLVSRSIHARRFSSSGETAGAVGASTMPASGTLSGPALTAPRVEHGRLEVGRQGAFVRRVHVYVARVIELGQRAADHVD